MKQKYYNVLTNKKKYKKENKKDSHFPQYLRSA